MIIKVLKKTSNELEIELEGENHTFCNVLQKALLEDNTIEMAGYNLPHPLISRPTVYVHTKGKRKPESALREASKKLLKQNKEFRKSFDEALKQWEKMG